MLRTANSRITGIDQVDQGSITLSAQDALAPHVNDGANAVMAKVVPPVNNTVQPTNNPKPKPVDE